MKKIKQIMIFVWMTIPFVGMSQKRVDILGNMKKGKGEIIYLMHNENNKNVIIDSAKVSFFGKYKLQAEVEMDDFYQLTMDKKNSHYLILKGGDKIQIKSSADFSDKNYIVKGSPDSKLIQEYFEVKNKKEITKDSLSKFAKKFVKENANSLAIFLAINDAGDIKNTITIAEKGIGSSYPNSNYHKNLQGALKQIAQSEKAKKASNSQIGNIAPEVNMKSPDGKIITLASLRGKYVLIDFWASWCGPCRRENPTVVRLYNKYKDRGFDVYSVSLDKNKSRWVAAIAKDKLTWGSHVSDLKGWGSAATGLYQFRGIPYTVLIDKEGKIIATRLRGASLENKLIELLGK